MSNPIVNGLPLGLRFYDSEDQQCRYKNTCQKNSHNEYQYADECTMPPFQVMRSPIPEATFDWYIVCVGSDVEYDINDICPDMVNSILLESIGIYDYITYLGIHNCCTLPFNTKSLVYIRLEDGINQWFSELFYINPAGVDTGDTNYRLWTAGGVRSSPDLRIWR
jgi:hypothetical protein